MTLQEAIRRRRAMLSGKLLYAIVLLLMCTMLGAAAGEEISWTGRAANGRWSDPGNWDAERVPGKEDAVIFGDDSENMPQRITLDQPAAIHTLEITATGQRAYTLTGEALTVLRPSAGSIYHRPTATVPFTLANEALRTTGSSFRNLSGQWLVIDAPITVVGEARTEFRDGRYALNAANDWGQRDLRLRTATFRIGDPEALSHAARGISFRGTTRLQLASDLAPGNSLDAWEEGAVLRLNLVASGDQDRLFELTHLGHAGSGDDGRVVFDENESGSTGVLTLRLTGNRLHSMPITTRAGTRIEFAIDDEATLGPENNEADGVIHGAGQLVKTGPGTLIVKSRNRYSGGTLIEAGTLRLAADEAAGVAGRLPAHGVVTLAGEATLDLGSTEQTVAALESSGHGGGFLELGTGRLHLAQAGDSRFEGTISGRGGITKSGAGQAVLAGNLSFTGTTLVAAGDLAVPDGLEAQEVRVAADAVLGTGGTLRGDLHLAGTWRVSGTDRTEAWGDIQLERKAQIAWAPENGRAPVRLGGESQTVTSESPVLIEITARDGLETDRPYTLLDWSTATEPDLQSLSAGDFVLVNPGWQGAFQKTDSGLEVTLSTIPEAADARIAFRDVVFRHLSPRHPKLRMADPRIGREATPEEIGFIPVNVFLDRAVYPSFARTATGRVIYDQWWAEGKPDVRLVLRVYQGDLIAAERVLWSVTGDTADFDLEFAHLPAGEYTFEATLLYRRNRVGGRAQRVFLVEDTPRPDPVGTLELAFAPQSQGVASWPVSFGVPFPRGVLPEEGSVRLTGADGLDIPLQTRAASRWSKQGDIRWLHIDTVLPVDPKPSGLQLHWDREIPEQPHGEAQLAREDEHGITVSTGPLRARFGLAPGAGLQQVWLEEEPLLREGAPGCGAIMTAADGTLFLAARDPDSSLTIEENGPVKAVIRHAGRHTDAEGATLGKFILRYRFWKDRPVFELDHTFIFTESSHDMRYRDIAYRLPVTAERYAFGTTGIVTGELGPRGSYLLQPDDLHYKVYEEGSFLTDGGRAAGWASAAGPAGSVSVAVRDFWQQYPKELGVTRNGLSVHFWPRHGEEVPLAEQVTPQTLHQLRFAHQGRLLDLRVPEEALELFATETGSDDVFSARHADAIGMAKTHHLLFYFHRTGWDSARVISHNAFFQEQPHVHVPPRWITAGDVLGALHPYDPERFPDMEQALRSTWRHIVRHQALDRDYGMWNFGDSHHWWNFEARRPRYHRLWYQTHHGFPRWPWMLYARSGDPELLDWARRNGRHVADVVHCHYAPPEYYALEWPRQKRTGGLHDYKGYVHWAAGGRFGYNSVSDAMLWHYYFTGDRRAQATALLHARGILRDGTPQARREGAGRLTSTIAAYRETWDNDYLEYIGNAIEVMLRTQRADGAFPQWEHFSPFLREYIALTGCPRAKQAMVHWGEWVIGHAAESGYRWRARHAYIMVLAEAHRISGNPRLLDTAARLLANVGDPADSDDPRRRDLYGISSTDRSYFLQEVPYYLRAEYHRSK